MSAMTIKNEVFYRSRWNKGLELYHHISEVRYPNTKLIKKKGRLNDIGESVLYASACELGTIIESRPDIEKPFTIAVIKPRNPGLFYFPLGMKDRNYLPSKLTKADQLVNDYINNEITKIVKCNDDYNSTIAMSNHFLKTRFKEELASGGIVYPSVESSKISNVTTYNVAILPKVFDEQFEITGAKMYCLTNEESHYQLNALNETIDIDDSGVLSWRFTQGEMFERITQGLALEDTLCEGIKCLNR